jgi:hypothetical protein
MEDTSKFRTCKATVVAIEPKVHQLLSRWCKKTGMKKGAAASTFITEGIKLKRHEQKTSKGSA